MKKSLYIALLSCSLLNAIEIKSIQFDGLIHLSPEIAQKITKLQVGQQISSFHTANAISSLFEQGYFDDIWIDEENGHLVVHVKEKPIVAMINIKGVSDEDKKALLENLTLKKGMNYDEENIANAKKYIIDFFESKGYFDTIVEQSSVSLSTPSSLEVTFEVNRGEDIIIRNIELSGANHLSYSDIEPNILNKQREWLGWMWGRNDGKLILPALPSDHERIRNTYMTKGYLDASVSNAYLRVDYNTYDANIIYKINEGSRYMVDEVGISQAEPIADTEKLKKELKLEKGDVFDVESLRKDIEKIRTHVADMGYAYASVYPDTKQDQENHKVSINYIINYANKVNIRKVIIGGNQKTADHVVRRYMYLSAGSLFNQTSLNDSKDALNRTGYFSEVNIEQKRISEDEMDLYVRVKEENTGNIRGGVGYATHDGILFDASVSDQNIFGSGIHGQLRITKSEDEYTGTISLNNPRFMDSYFSLGGKFYIEDDSWDSYEERRVGGSMSVGRDISRNAHILTSYTLQKTTLEKLAKSLKDTGYKEGESIKSSFSLGINYDNTDDYYLPRRGVQIGTVVEYAGIGGDEKFIKNNSKFSMYYNLNELAGLDWILRYKSKLRFAWDRGYLPINERLYMGGLGSVRGYLSRTIGPKNSLGYYYGGTKAFSNSLELSVPLVKRIKMRLAGFVDFGMVGVDKIDEHKRASAGLALEWRSPLGPLQLIFAKPIKPKPGDDTTNFEFTIGSQF